VQEIRGISLVFREMWDTTDVDRNAASDVQKWTVQAKIEQSSRLLRRYA
jgi:hypothetical protein